MFTHSTLPLVTQLWICAVLPISTAFTLTRVPIIFNLNQFSGSPFPQTLVLSLGHQTQVHLPHFLKCKILYYSSTLNLSVASPPHLSTVKLLSSLYYNSPVSGPGILLQFHLMHSPISTIPPAILQPCGSSTVHSTSCMALHWPPSFCPLIY